LPNLEDPHDLLTPERLVTGTAGCHAPTPGVHNQVPLALLVPDSRWPKITRSCSRPP
jgi:hypothetical protein